MGLAAPKNRMKLSHDPNNTKWTNDTESFGHKMMISQGWEPGQNLGVKDSAHAVFHTEANASHIRVSIKDDNLGLGAKIGSGVGHGECTGLDAFKNLLGRLNGKDEDELEKEQKSREELKRAIYTERKWGSIRFVPGGLLVGDKIQSLIEAESERVRKLADGSSSDSSDSDSESKSEEEPPAPVVEKTKKSKKRKVEELEEAVFEVAVKSKKSNNRRKSEVNPEDEEVTAALKEVKLSKKKSKKVRDSKPDTEDTQDEERSRRKTEKKEKKERKERKKERQEKKDKSRATLDEETTKELKKKDKREKKKAKDSESSESSQVATKERKPVVTKSSGPSTPIIMQGRHAVRARNIAQKRLASMDAASLNQIFMIKS